MGQTVTMMGVLALAATTALAQSTTTAPGQPGQSGTSTSGQSATGSDARKGQSTSAAGTGQLSPADRRFIEAAARGGMAEVELGRLGTEKASSPEVKALAQMIVDDHSKANDELKTLASQKGVTLPMDTDAKFKATKARLDKLSGGPFERAFMEEVLKDHKKDVAEFQREARSAGGDGEVKSWASKMLPALEQHLQHAQQASNTSGGTSATSTDSKGEKKKPNPPPDSRPR